MVGLHLAALSMRNRSDPVDFALKIAQHGHQAIAEYLLSEVLAGLPETQRDCLLQTSLFNRFCAPLIDWVQADDGLNLAGDDFVRDIQRANLFVVSLDYQGTWLRYHHFFQSLLRARLGQRYATAQIKAIHARASVWFSQQGLVGEAITHALKAGDAIGAASLVEAEVGPALDREDWQQIEHWLEMLPADVKGRPRLLLAQAWLHFIRWQLSGVKAHLESTEAALDAGRPALNETEISLRGEIALLRAAMAQNGGDTKLCLQYSKAALTALRPDMHYLMGLAQFYYIWALQVNGEYEKAIDYAHRQLDALGWQADGLSLRLILALATIHFEMANVAALQDIMAIWLKLSTQSGLGLSIGWSLFGQGWLAYQRNELAAAAVSFRRVTDIDWMAHGRSVFDSYTGLVLTWLAQDRPDEASHVIVELNELLLERGMLPFSGVAQSLEQRVALARGSESALGWQLNEKLVPVSDILWEMPALTQVVTLLAAGGCDELEQGAALLEDCRAKALARNANRRLIEIGALQALVLAAKGDETAALNALQEAVERAEPGGALRLLADFGPGLIGLLQKLQTEGVAPRYIEKVLTVLVPPVSGPAVPAIGPDVAAAATKQEAPADMLTNREIDVLLLLAERLTDKEIAERLVLSLLTVKKHTQRIYRKLGVHNRRAAVVQARRLGLI